MHLSIFCANAFLFLALQAGQIASATGVCASELTSPDGATALKQDSTPIVQRYIQAIRTISALHGQKYIVSCNGFCEVSSKRLFDELTAMGFPVKRFLVDRLELYKQNEFVPGAPKVTFHFFLVDNQSIPGQEILIDATYRQFFLPTPGLPEFFVGTRSEFEALFKDFSEHLYITSDPPRGNNYYDPVASIEVIYGFGRGAKSKAGNPLRETPADL